MNHPENERSSPMTYRWDEKYRDYLTEKQWLEKGFVVKRRHEGVMLKYGKYRNDYATYFGPDEVREAFEDELKKKKYKMKYAGMSKSDIKAAKAKEAGARKYRKAKKENETLTQELLQSLSTEPELEIVFDTETTGLDSERDEILQLSIIDTNGNTLYNNYFRPLKHLAWPDAEKVNHISPQMLKAKGTIFDDAEAINAILLNAKTIIGYNVNFDLRFLVANGYGYRPDAKIIDVMDNAVGVYGRYTKLTTFSTELGFDWSSVPAHNSLGDCLATLYCLENYSHATDVVKIEYHVQYTTHWFFHELDTYYDSFDEARIVYMQYSDKIDAMEPTELARVSLMVCFRCKVSKCDRVEYLAYNCTQHHAEQERRKRELEESEQIY